ncbi:MAG: SGNH/GDSL hydrolase family protein [Eggerthellaceae bacterium]|nr:SGNH/GDSL hydrolase family protein [Eggerthellaceae bacterium]
MKEVWVVVGDSFSDPAHAGYGEYGVRAWPLVLADAIGVEVRCYASSGDGYVHRRAETFPEQARRAAADAPALGPVSRVVVYGGINDYSMGVDPADVGKAAAETAMVLVAAFPDAHVEGFMNWYPHELDAPARDCIAAIREGLGRAGVPLSTDSMWILENDEVGGSYLPDNLHPDQRGHNLMAAFFAMSRRIDCR